LWTLACSATATIAACFHLRSARLSAAIFSLSLMNTVTFFHLSRQAPQSPIHPSLVLLLKRITDVVVVACFVIIAVVRPGGLLPIHFSFSGTDVSFAASLFCLATPHVFPKLHTRIHIPLPLLAYRNKQTKRNPLLHRCRNGRYGRLYNPAPRGAIVHCTILSRFSLFVGYNDDDLEFATSPLSPPLYSNGFRSPTGGLTLSREATVQPTGTIKSHEVLLLPCASPT